MDTLSIYSQRTISAFPISIGTSLVLESIFTGRLPPYDPDREIPQHVDINKYAMHYFNVRTLARNMIGALPNSDARKAVLTDIDSGLSTLLEEIDIITDIYSNEGKGVCTPIFYVVDYDPILNSNKPYIIPRSYSGYRYMENEYISKLCKLALNTGVVTLYKPKLPTVPNRSNALITTHIPFDLVSNINGRMDLLESHTGRLKTRLEWYTKYHSLGKEDMSTLPFLEKLLYVFGDNVMFKPHKISVRGKVLDISRKRKWTPTTTEMKVKYYLEIDYPDLYRMLYR